MSPSIHELFPCCITSSARAVRSAERHQFRMVTTETACRWCHTPKSSPQPVAVLSWMGSWEEDSGQLGIQSFHCFSQQGTGLNHWKDTEGAFLSWAW